MRAYDVIGVAGCRRRVPNQPAWCFLDTQWTKVDADDLSGKVANAKHPFGTVVRFGEVPMECELLDGVLLVARRSVLRERRVAFDTRFAFHFYDMDFCRSARKAGLHLGTWPISITHQSAGSFNSEAWAKMLETYREKWRD
jgi:GT2 family glycosyltransferase